jgi:drug/metabolite transporter (DMT)-like permease
MLVAVGFFAFMDTVLKVLSTRYPALQVAALRGWVALPLVLLWIQWRHAWHTLLHIRWPLHLLRGVLAIAMLSLFTRGLQGLPLANAYTLFFIAPLLITLLSSRVLGERVPRAHWWAVAGGMLGVLVALRPGMDGFVSWSGLAVHSYRLQRKPDALDHGHGSRWWQCAGRAPVGRCPIAGCLAACCTGRGRVWRATGHH